MKIRILDAVAMGVELSYSDGDIAEVNYNTEDDDLVDVHHKPLAYLCEWENKYFEVIREGVMKIKLIDYTGPTEDRKDVTIGEVYEAIGEDSHGHMYIIDDVDQEHWIQKGCFEVIGQKPWYKTGELPPVGEILENIETGHRVEIACHFYGTAVYWDFKTGGFSSGMNEDFKPLKSQEEIEKEKQVEELNEHLDNWFSNELYDDANEKTLSEYLYSLGYRKIK